MDGERDAVAREQEQHRGPLKTRHTEPGAHFSPTCCRNE